MGAHVRSRHPRSSEGPSSGDVPKGGAGSGVLRRRLVTAQPREARDPARQALRPGCEELALRIRRKCRRRKRGPRPKIATVERREASASRWTRAAPRQAWTVARHERDNRQLAPFGAPLVPHGVDGKERSKIRARKCAAGTKEAGLLEMVKMRSCVARMKRSEIRGWCQAARPPRIALRSMRATKCTLPPALENLTQALRRHRQAGDRAGHAERVVDGGGDRRAHGVDPALPRPFEPERIERGWRVLRDQHVER